MQYVFQAADENTAKSVTALHRNIWALNANLRVALVTLRAELSLSILSCPTDTPPFSGGLNLLSGRDKFKVTRNLLLWVWLYK